MRVVAGFWGAGLVGLAGFAAAEDASFLLEAGLRGVAGRVGAEGLVIIVEDGGVTRSCGPRLASRACWCFAMGDSSSSSAMAAMRFLLVTPPSSPAPRVFDPERLVCRELVGVQHDGSLGGVLELACLLRWRGARVVESSHQLRETGSSLFSRHAKQYKYNAGTFFCASAGFQGKQYGALIANSYI